jgi:hypothetical protein
MAVCDHCENQTGEMGMKTLRCDSKKNGEMEWLCENCHPETSR